MYTKLFESLEHALHWIEGISGFWTILEIIFTRKISIGFILFVITILLNLCVTWLKNQEDQFKREYDKPLDELQHKASKYFVTITILYIVFYAVTALFAFIANSTFILLWFSLIWLFPCFYSLLTLVVKLISPTRSYDFGFKQLLVTNLHAIVIVLGSIFSSANIVQIIFLPFAFLPSIIVGFIVMLKLNS